MSSKLITQAYDPLRLLSSESILLYHYRPIHAMYCCRMLRQLPADLYLKSFNLNDSWYRRFHKTILKTTNAVTRFYSQDLFLSCYIYIFNNKNCDKSRSQSPQKHHSLHKNITISTKAVYIFLYSWSTWRCSITLKHAELMLGWIIIMFDWTCCNCYCSELNGNESS
jgi:hypothetical protein